MCETFVGLVLKTISPSCQEPAMGAAGALHSIFLPLYFRAMIFVLMAEMCSDKVFHLNPQIDIPLS